MPWDNEDRINAISDVLLRIPHDQIASGTGLSLRHNAESCARCKATIALQELNFILNPIEEIEGEIGYDDLGNQILVRGNISNDN